MLKLLIPHRLGLLALSVTVALFGLLLGWGLPAQSASAQDNSGGLAIAIDGSGVDCDASQCIVDKGSDFTLTVSVTSAPAAGYIGLGTQIQYQNLTYTATEDKEDEMLVSADGFPGISVRSMNAEAASVSHGMTAGTPPSFTTSHYEGPIVEVALTCTDDYSRNDVQLPPRSAENTLGAGFKLPSSAGGLTIPAGDSLLIHCGPPPTATPAPPTSVATSTPGPGLPTTGSGDNGSSQTTLWFVIGALLAAGAIASVGVLSMKQARR